MELAALAKVLSCHLALLCLLSVWLCSGTEGEFLRPYGDSGLMGMVVGVRRRREHSLCSRLACEFPKLGWGWGSIAVLS